MKNQGSQIWVVVTVIAIIGGFFYYLGTKSGEMELATDSAENYQTTPSPQPVTTNTDQPIQSVAERLVEDGVLGLSCKKIAETVAQSRQRSGVIVYVTQSNFSKNHNNCYYELNFTYPEGNSSTELHVAPNDDWIAQCTTGIYPDRAFCTPHNTFYPDWQGQMTEVQYKQIRDQYLIN